MKKIIAFALLTLSFQEVYAACKPADAKGTWITYQAAFIVPSSLDQSHIGQCKLVVDTKGNISYASSSCEFISLSDKIPTGGTFKVNSDCSADINLDLGSFVGQVQLTTNKLAYSGRFQTETVSGITNAVKQ